MVNSIIDMIEAKRAGDNIPRQYLGLSEIGHKCPRWLWYAHHNTPSKPVEGRIIRLFRTGNIIEDAIISDLESIDIEVTDRQREVEIVNGDIVLRGHIDGIVSGQLLEIKSANEKSFKQLLKVGYEKWNPKYKAQAHVYMVLCDLEECMVVVENKNDSNLYIETLKLDRDYVTKLLIDVFAAITLPEPPERICPDVSWYESKCCKYQEFCFT
jgi:hypothetical protein